MIPQNDFKMNSTGSNISFYLLQVLLLLIFVLSASKGSIPPSYIADETGKPHIISKTADETTTPNTFLKVTDQSQRENMSTIGDTKNELLSVVVTGKPRQISYSKNGTQKNVPVRPKCFENLWFKNLSMCKKDCNGTVNPGDDEDRSVNNMRLFKLIILRPNEYKRDNGTLWAYSDINLSFQKKYYTIGNNGTAYLCLRLPDWFVDCKKWQVEKKDYEFKGRKIWVSDHKKHYEVSEYLYLRRKEAISTCVFEYKEDFAYLIGWFLSLISLGATIILGQIFSELNLKGNRLLLANFIMLFLAYTTLCIKKIQMTYVHGTWCYILAYVQQYSFLSAFCWINVQAIDIFLHFINLRPHSTDSKAELKRFFIYAFHGWGTPFWITVITAAVNGAETEHLNPRIGETCWFNHHDKAGSFLYFYGPIALILIINFILFIITITKLCKIGKGANHMKKGKQKLLFKVYLKLIVVMGLCWIMEVLSVAIGGDPEIWIFTDMINALQGLFIFIVYVCKPSFLKKCFNKCCRHPGCPSWWPLKPITDSSTYRVGETTASTTNNSTLGRDISLVSTGDKL